MTSICSICKQPVPIVAAPCLYCDRGEHDLRMDQASLVAPAEQGGAMVKTAKRYLAGQVIGSLTIGASILACSLSSGQVSAALFAAGFVMLMGARMGAWWFNE